MNAMVVDDSRAMRKIVARLLKEHGFVVAEATDGEDALAQLEAGPLPIVAMIDWNMPKMDGMQLLATMRADPRFCDIKIVMITTEVEIESMVAALEAGADDYLMKPFTNDVLRDKLMLVGAM